MSVVQIRPWAPLLSLSLSLSLSLYVNRRADLAIRRIAVATQLLVFPPLGLQAIDVTSSASRIPSQPEISLLDHPVLAHFGRGAGAGDSTILKDIDVIGEPQALIGVLLDEDDRLSSLG